MTFDQLLEIGTPAVVLFYGASCAPCARLKPRMLALEQKLGFHMTMFNVASEMDAVRRLGIRTVPTVVFVNDGHAEVLFCGDLTEESIEVMLKEKGIA